MSSTSCQPVITRTKLARLLQKKTLEHYIMDRQGRLIGALGLFCRAKNKSIIYKSVIKPTITYGAECWTMKKKDAMKIFAVDTRRYP